MVTPGLIQTVATLGAAALVSASAASTIHVDDDAPAGGDGLTWATAQRFLQDALAGAGDDAEIRVAPGVYRTDRDSANPGGSGDRLSVFRLATGVRILGGFAGLGAKDPDARDVEQYESVLSGDLAGDDGPDFANDDENSYHVVLATDADPTAVLDGFTVRGGHAEGSPYPNAVGGGAYIELASPTIRRCTFTGNRARSGGGVDARGSYALFEDCRFIGNHAESNAGGLHAARRSAEWGDVRLVRCEFRGNHSVVGGGLGTNRGQVTVESCTFIENTAERRGATTRCGSSAVPSSATAPAHAGAASPPAIT